MVIKTSDIKEMCSKILFAVDSSELSVLTDTLQMNVVDGFFNLAVTNRQYFARVKFPVDFKNAFNATVNATTFLKLVSQITTETIELSISDSFLLIKGNGEYKLPLIFDGEQLLKLPEILIANKTASFEIGTDILNSILLFNSKEISKSTAASPVQRLYYIDEGGAITFTSGACVNKFTLNQPVKILLNPSFVRLFKLFKGDKVHFTLGYDALNEEIIQTKVCFEDDSITLTAIISSDDSMINTVPAGKIRERAFKSYPYSVVLNKNALIQTINRLMLFKSPALSEVCGKFIFGPDSVLIYDGTEQNSEEIFYNNTSNLMDTYTAILSLPSLKAVLENHIDQHVNVSFGDKQAFVISNRNIYNVIPEYVK